jgi:hypothetical protein
VPGQKLGIFTSEVPTKTSKKSSTSSHILHLRILAIITSIVLCPGASGNIYNLRRIILSSLCLLPPFHLHEVGPIKTKSKKNPPKLTASGRLCATLRTTSRPATFQNHRPKAFFHRLDFLDVLVKIRVRWANIVARAQKTQVLTTFAIQYCENAFTRDDDRVVRSHIQNVRQ